MLRYDDDGQASKPAEILFIDRDWSGEAGADKYLFNPNPMLGHNELRPEAVICGALWFPLLCVLACQAKQAMLQPALKMES